MVKTIKNQRINALTGNKVLYNRTVYYDFDTSRHYIKNAGRKVLVRKKVNGVDWLAPYTGLK